MAFRRRLSTALLALAASMASAAVSPGPLTQFVNVFAGTAQNSDPGNVFAGASVPFGMAKVTINVAGRNNEAYNRLGYIRYDFLESTGVGQHTREFSRGLEYAFGDFAAGMAGRALGKPREAWQPLLDRSLGYRTNYNPALESDGYRGFVARRLANGTFLPSNPVDCSPRDSDRSRPCSLQATNVYGGHESSSWEYSFYAPHDGAGLVRLLGGNDTLAARLRHFFDEGYNVVGNEPSFQTPSLYHHVGLPGSSVRQSRRIVLDNFNLTRGGSPGNDDNAAMSSLVVWYMLGFYPVPASAEMLVLSPFVPGYTVRNELLGDVRVTVTGFDPTSLNSTIPAGARAFVDDLKLDGRSMGRCRIDFDQFFAAKNVEFVMTAEEKTGCAGQEPNSVSTGGFPVPGGLE
ncbi:glycosyl hydrolase [Magnaporthiopsis poae ATCC 64411]|uniref:Glycosyl hydrolase n=1 Tax=Magnaporthiopsis poae (strain ATCC 64411 / 73-15) TaxID=644358 RepID=A0A0C4DYJ0_MAGP6|nr:glycosyl hydrolase [Magnaporthiopsis poae ATCC 64411]